MSSDRGDRRRLHVYCGRIFLGGREFWWRYFRGVPGRAMMQTDTNVKIYWEVVRWVDLLNTSAPSTSLRQHLFMNRQHGSISSDALIQARTPYSAMSSTSSTKLVHS